MGISVSILEKIATVMGLDASYLMKDEDNYNLPLITKHDQGERYKLNRGILYEQLSPANSHFGLSGISLRSKPRENSGELTAHLGDALSHSSEMLHGWENIGAEEGAFLVVSTMPSV